MPRTTNVVSSAARTTDGQSSVVSTGSSVSVLVDVTAVSGTSPSMTVSVEWSADGATFAAADPADQLTAFTAAGRAVKTFDARAEFFRLAWAITGTSPSFTFSASVFG